MDIAKWNKLISEYKEKSTSTQNAINTFRKSLREFQIAIGPLRERRKTP